MGPYIRRVGGCARDVVRRATPRARATSIARRRARAGAVTHIAVRSCAWTRRVDDVGARRAVVMAMMGTMTTSTMRAVMRGTGVEARASARARVIGRVEVRAGFSRARVGVGCAWMDGARGWTGRGSDSRAGEL